MLMVHRLFCAVTFEASPLSHCLSEDSSFWRAREALLPSWNTGNKIYAAYPSFRMLPDDCCLMFIRMSSAVEHASLQV